MPGEVIRDVILRVNIQHGDVSGINKAAEAANRMVNAGSSLGASVNNRLSGMEASLEKTKLLIKSVTEEYVSLGKKAGAELDVLIRREKDLAAAIRQRDAAIKGAGTPGGGVIPGRPVPQSAPGAGFTGTIAGVQSGLSTALAPIAIAAMVPAVANQISDAVAVANRAIFGPDSERKGYDSFSNFAGNSLNSDFAQSFLNSGVGSLLTRGQDIAGSVTGFPSFKDFAAQFKQALDFQSGLGSGPTDLALMQDEAKARQQVIDGMMKQVETQATATRTEIGLHDQRIASIKGVIAAEEARIDSAREQFGLLDAQQKKDFLTITQKVAGQGVGSLSKSELELVKGNSAFTGLLSEQAKKGADDAGFSKIVELLELDKKIQQEERQLELNLEVKQIAEIELKGLEKPLEKFRTELDALMQKVVADQLTESVNALQRALRQRDLGTGPDF